MNISKLAASLLLLAPAPSAAAQTLPQDVRCLMLSNMFAAIATDPAGRQAAAQSLIFYVARLEGRGDARMIATVMRAQRATIVAQTASADMLACGTRMQRASQVIQDAMKAAAPPAPAK